MLIVSHRGRGSRRIENTLDAFSWAASIGVDGIETDLRRTRDERVVLFHDRVLTQSDVRVADLTHAELELATGVPIPTLEDALQLLPDVWWLLEIKSADVVPAVERILRRSSSLPRITLISFWHPLIGRLSQRIPVEFGLTLAHDPAPGHVEYLAKKIRAEAPAVDSIVWNFEFLSASTVQALRQYGLQCIAYGVDVSQDLADCRDWDVRSVMTDAPEMVRNHVRDWSMNATEVLPDAIGRAESKTASQEND